jgi:outer membrane receptor for ferric coprogen and ferric-rhodotorulic acid
MQRLPHHLSTLACAAALACQAAAAQSPTAPSTTDATLAPVTVSAEAERPSATTEHSGAFASPKVSLGKSTQAVRHIPQPVTVLTREFLDQRSLPDLHDVMQNTPGVTVDYVDSERVNYFSRGYQIDALQVDGLTFTQGGSVFVQPDTALLDRVEVLRGASGMLRGSGNPSGTVNLVRKRPTDSFQASASVAVGSWSRRRLSADIGGPLNDTGTLRGRLVAVSDDKAFFQKARSEERKVLYGVVEADLTPRTKLTASLQHTDLNATGAWGNLPAALNGSSLDLPRDTYLGAAWNRWNRYNQQASAELTHGFENDWAVKISATHLRMRMKDDYGFKQSYITRATGATNPYLFNVTTSAYSGDQSNQNVVGVTANGPFQWLGRQHELTVGAETQRIGTVGTKGYFNISPLNGVDIRTWNPYTSYAEPSTSGSIAGTAYVAPDNVISQRGTYAASKLSVTDRWNVLAGARLSWYDYAVPSNARSNYSVNRELTPYLGSTYDLSPNLSAYASYTEIFTPQSNYYDAAGSLLDPIRGKDFELGLKGEFLQGKLQTSLAVFRIDNEGKAVLDTGSGNPCRPYYTSSNCYMNGGKTQSEGFELEVSGAIAQGWQVMAGYTNTRTRVVKDSTASTQGQPLRSMDPKHQLRLFSTYKLGGVLAGLTVGGGAQIQSAGYVTSGALTARQGGYGVFNAMLAYQINPTYSVQVNLNNLSDKVYYKKYQPTGIGNYYGDPRNVMLTLQGKFS